LEIIAASSRHLRRRLVGGALAKLGRLELFNVLKPIHDAAADLDVTGTFPRPASALERAVADVPASGELDLVQMSDRHLLLLRVWPNACAGD